MPYTIPIQLTDHPFEEALTHQGELVLHCTCALPRLHGLPRRAETRINRYCRRMEQAVQHTCRTVLLPQAARTAEGAHAAALPFAPLEASLTWETTCRTDALWSLLWRWQVIAGDTPLLYRQQGEVWSLTSGLPCPLSRFEASEKRRNRIAHRVRKAARREGLPGPGRRLSFALTEDGLLCFWPTCPHPARCGDYFSLTFPSSDPERMKF